MRWQYLGRKSRYGAWRELCCTTIYESCNHAVWMRRTIAKRAVAHPEKALLLKRVEEGGRAAIRGR